VSFSLISEVALVGGFAGLSDPVDPDQRDPAQFVSTLSGDNNRDDPVLTDNAYHVVNASFVGQNTRLDGFTIIGGYAVGGVGDNQRGGGLFAFSGSVSVESCRFVGNQAAADGGGAALPGSFYSWWRNCTFEGNAAPTGGAVSLQNSLVFLVNDRFDDNVATAAGGAIYSLNSNNSAIVECTFEHNSSAAGGAVACISSMLQIRSNRFADNQSPVGGAIRIENASPIVFDCVFLRNRATAAGDNRGGAIAVLNNSAPQIFSCHFYSNLAEIGRGGALYVAGTSFNPQPRLFNCVFSGNSAAGGGAILCDQVNGGVSSTYVDNCTFSRNSAVQGGGLLATRTGSAGAYVSIANSIFSENFASLDSQIGGVIPGAVEIDVNYSCVQGGWTDPASLGVITGNPQFLDADGPNDQAGDPDDNLRLARWITGPASPCIDAGSVSYLMTDAGDFDADGDPFELMPLDADGVLRRVDEFNTPDFGDGPPPLPDMGAYEAQDCDGDGQHDGQQL
jgi:predicted outer membrane repeat protein